MEDVKKDVEELKNFMFEKEDLKQVKYYIIENQQNFLKNFFELGVSLLRFKYVSI